MFFKIFLLLFLQQGAKTSLSDGAASVNWESVLLAQNATLMIQADPIVLEQVLNVCSSYDMACQIKREIIGDEDTKGFEKATVGFANLALVTKARMLEQLKNFQPKASLQWNDLNPNNK